MKKVYETPNVVITTFESLDAINTTAYSTSIAGPKSANTAKVTKVTTLN